MTKNKDDEGTKGLNVYFVAKADIRTFLSN